MALFTRKLLVVATALALVVASASLLVAEAQQQPQASAWQALSEAPEQLQQQAEQPTWQQQRLDEQLGEQWQPRHYISQQAEPDWTWQQMMQRQAAQQMQQAQLRFLQAEQQQQLEESQSDFSEQQRADVMPRETHPRRAATPEDDLSDLFGPVQPRREMTVAEREALRLRWFGRRSSAPLSDAELAQLRLKWALGHSSDDRKRAESEEPAWRVACHQKCEERTIELSGVGLRSVPSDKAEVRATIEVRRMVNTSLTHGTLEPDELDELIGGVQRELSARANNVIRLLTGNGTAAAYVSRLRTSSIGLEPIYEYKDGRQWLAGYRASNTITFRAEVTRAGAVIDAIVEAGVTRIDGVTYFASPAKINEARMAAIGAAVDDVMEQAASALSALGASSLADVDKRPLQIIRLDITGVTRPEPPNYAGDSSIAAQQYAAPYANRAFVKAEAISAIAATPIEGEDRVVSAEVRMKARF